MTTMFRADKEKIFVAIPAQTAKNSAATSMERHAYASFHAIWTGLTTGTAVNATLKVQVSNDPRVLTDPTNAAWDDKTGSSLNIVAIGSGNKMFSLNDIVTEDFYRMSWDGGGVTGGALSVYMVKKG